MHVPSRLVKMEGPHVSKSFLASFIAVVIGLIARLLVLPNLIKYSEWCEMTSMD